MSPEQRAYQIVCDTFGAESGWEHVTRWIADAIRKAVTDRDMEWWEKCACVDNVDPTPEAVERWIGVSQQYFIEQAVAAERTACAKVAREMGPTFYSKEMREAADAISRVIEARTTTISEVEGAVWSEVRIKDAQIKALEAKIKELEKFVNEQRLRIIELTEDRP